MQLQHPNLSLHLTCQGLRPFKADEFKRCANVIMKNFVRQDVKLSLFFFLLLFLAGRIGLFLHEFAGHALSWRLLGGRLADFSLFVFGGGRVHYGWTPATLNLSTFSMLFALLSGIAVELAVGIPLALLAVFSRATRATKALFAATSSVLIVHSLFYLVICTYYGSRDGAVLFTVLQGGTRQVFLALTFGLTIVGAFLVSYAFSPTVRSWVVGRSSKQRVVLIILGMFGAVLLHGTLTVSEQVIVKDKIYAEIKTAENVRLKEKELAEFVAKYTEEHRREPEQEHVAVVENELEEKYWQFPIEIPLAIAIVIAFVAGFFLSVRKDHGEASPVVWKDIGLLGCFSVPSVLLILILNKL